MYFEYLYIVFVFEYFYYVDFRYCYIRNFEIPKYRPFYICSFQMLTPTGLRSLGCLWALECLWALKWFRVLEWLGIHATKIFKNLVDKNEYDKITLIPALHPYSFYRFFPITSNAQVASDTRLIRISAAATGIRLIRVSEVAARYHSNFSRPFWISEFWSRWVRVGVPNSIQITFSTLHHHIRSAGPSCPMGPSSFTSSYYIEKISCIIQLPNVYKKLQKRLFKLAIHIGHSTEYCRNMSEIFPIFHCNWNIAATFLSIIPKYFIATLQF